MNDELLAVTAPAGGAPQVGEAALAFVIPAYQPSAILPDIIRAILTET